VLQLPDETARRAVGAGARGSDGLVWFPRSRSRASFSLKTGGCPEDCHFCSQSGLFASPVRSAWLDIPSLVEAAQTDPPNQALPSFCIVAAVRGPDERLLASGGCGYRGDPRCRGHPDRLLAGYVGAPSRWTGSRRWACTATNHNLETARSFFPNVVTTHSWEERLGPRCRWCARPAWRVLFAEASSAWARRLSSAPSSPPNLAELETGRGFR